MQNKAYAQGQAGKGAVYPWPIKEGNANKAYAKAVMGRGSVRHVFLQVVFTPACSFHCWRAFLLCLPSLVVVLATLSLTIISASFSFSSYLTLLSNFIFTNYPIRHPCSGTPTVSLLPLSSFTVCSSPAADIYLMTVFSKSFSRRSRGWNRGFLPICP